MLRRRAYEKLSQDEPDTPERAKFYRDDSFTQEQFERPKPKTPWVAIIFITFLFIFGVVAITMSSFILIGYFDTKYTDRFLPLLILGSLMFIPGAYYFRIIVLIMLKNPNFSYDDIPEFN